MLNKVYTCRGTIHIIENAKDVTIHDGAFDYHDRSKTEFVKDSYVSAWGPKSINSEMFNQVMFDIDPREHSEDLKYLAPETGLCKLVDYTNEEGVRHRLVVFHLAYVCTDKGKTIDKVIVARIGNQPDIASTELAAGSQKL